MRRAAVAVGILSCIVSILALLAGLLYIASSPVLGFVLLGLGVVTMEGGACLVRGSKEPSTLTLSSPAIGGAISGLALALGLFMANAGSKLAPDDEPVWLRWALFGVAGLCGWVGIRAAWHAISGSKRRGSA
jgi:hypothetical protein